MTIGIDLRILARDANTGVEEYAKKLLSFLIPLDKSIKYKIFYNGYKKIPLDYEWARAENIEVFESKIPNKFLEISGRFDFPKIDRLLGGIDIFFQPHFLPAALSRKIKRVITFHDLSFERYSEFFSQHQKFWHKRIDPRGQAKQADKIIAISKSTKNDLVDLYGIAPDKIRVIHSGVSFPKNIAEIEKKSCVAKYNLPANFILFLGTLEPRKNVLGVVKAFEVLKNSQKSDLLLLPSPQVMRGGEQQDLKLVIAGGRGWLCNELFDYVAVSKYKDDIIFLGRVLDKEKEILYSLASVFVFPSFFEGFGFPPLEAMACGTPVVTSNVSSLPEVAGDGAIMVNPYHVDEIAGAVKMLLDNGNLRDIIIEKGRERARQFLWQKCAEETFDFIIGQEK